VAKWIVDDPGGAMTALEALDDATMRRIRRQMVENGAKVLLKELPNTIEQRHHVVSGALKGSVGVGKIYEDLDGTSIDVYPQGDDPRGVNNEMKLKIINYGFYHSASGKRQYKKDFFLGEKFRKKCEPRIRGVMMETLRLCMEELNNK